MAVARKATIRLGGIGVSARGSIAWRFQTGVKPYLAIFSVHKSKWPELEHRMGEFMDLEVNDARNTPITVRDLTILHKVPSDGPKRVSFVVADKRWKWAYKLVARDYNVPRKTGDRTRLSHVPIETSVTVDQFDFKPYSLNGDTKWTPRGAVEDIGKVLEGTGGEGAAGGGGVNAGGNSNNAGFLIESFPIESQEQGTSDGQFTLQNIILRDQGDIALARLLSYVPGAAVWVDAEGVARVFDAADLDAVERHYNELPPSTWDGENAAFIDRSQIRPGKVLVHYQREVELMLEFEDAWISGRTIAGDYRSSPYIDNVIPTVDPTTTITEYDPEADKDVEREVPAGTYIRADKWLEAMDADKPEGSLPWTWDTIKRHWLHGDLDGVLGGKGLDLDEDGNVSSRIQALKQHFRQTFRVNRRYMERVRDIQAVRVTVLDPVTGARPAAAVWGQACVIPTKKGKLMAGRKDPEKAFVYRNVDQLPDTDADEVQKKAPGPARVNILDRDLGIFRLEWIASPYGTVDTYLPCHLVGEKDATKPRVPTRNLAQQDDEPMGPGMKLEGGTNGIFLRDTMKYKVLLTIVPAAPNSKAQFHVESVSADDIKAQFRAEFRIQGGGGPDLEVYVPPGESTARFAWDEDGKAARTIQLLLGLTGDGNPGDAGLNDDPETERNEANDLGGFIFTNWRREIMGHSKAVGAELLAAFADNLQGKTATILPGQGVRLRGNMSGATLQVAAAPSAKVNVVHEFPGQQKPISRLALMPESTRMMVLGIVPFGKGDA